MALEVSKPRSAKDKKFSAHETDNRTTADVRNGGEERERCCARFQMLQEVVMMMMIALLQRAVSCAT